MQTYDAQKTTTDVRQGSRKLTNFRVLLWSLLAVVVAFGAIYIFFFSMTPEPVPTAPSVTAPSETSPSPAAPTTTPTPVTPSP
jgi:hypothetical protein